MLVNVISSEGVEKLVVFADLTIDFDLFVDSFVDNFVIVGIDFGEGITAFWNLYFFDFPELIHTKWVA